MCKNVYTYNSENTHFLKMMVGPTRRLKNGCFRGIFMTPPPSIQLRSHPRLWCVEYEVQKISPNSSCQSHQCTMLSKSFNKCAIWFMASAPNLNNLLLFCSLTIEQFLTHHFSNQHVCLTLLSISKISLLIDKSYKIKY